MDNSIFKLRFDYSPLGDDIQRKNIIGGENIYDLRDYRTFLGVQHNRQNTIDRYYNSAKHYLTHSKNIVSEQTVQEYLCYLNQNKKRNTITSEIIGLNKFLRYLHRDHLCHPIPRWDVIQRDILSKEEIQQMLSHARDNYHLMEYLIVLFVVDLDCRPHEIVKAKWNWVKGNKIYFDGCKTGNTYGYLTSELQTYLSEWNRLQNPSSEFIFTHQRSRYKGEHIANHCAKIRDLIHTLTKEVVGRVLNPQDLRASVITNEFNNYINPKVIQRKARHRSFKTTMKYNHVDDRQLLEYLDNGTIFNNVPLSKHKSEISENKPYVINTYVPHTVSLGEENSCFSFSVSFFSDFFCADRFGWGTGVVSPVFFVGTIFFIMPSPIFECVVDDTCSPPPFRDGVVG